jgi:hypothetical protein
MRGRQQLHGVYVEQGLLDAAITELRRSLAGAPTISPPAPNSIDSSGTSTERRASPKK